MHVLLPPSETKRHGGGIPYVPDRLAYHAALGSTRLRVRQALQELCGDADTAVAALKLGAKSRSEIAHNLALDVSGAMPAIERYTGVLYDALDVTTLEDQARDWLDAHVSVQSALFGLIAAGDRIPRYRISAHARLPALGSSLKQLWVPPHAGIDWRQFGLVLDLRSKEYAALAPLDPARGVWLQLVQRDESGSLRSLNHFNKAAKGSLVRQLALDGIELNQVSDLACWLEAQGHTLLAGSSEGEATVILAGAAHKHSA